MKTRIWYEINQKEEMDIRYECNKTKKDRKITQKGRLRKKDKNKENQKRTQRGKMKQEKEEMDSGCK